MTVKQALLSVSDKEGIVEFAKELLKMNVRIISSGGTASVLKKNKVDCMEVSKVTGFPEILNGRVKTLHPNIHGAILAKRSDKKHMDQLKELNIEEIDIVAVNLYPFEKTLNETLTSKDSGKITDDIIENIDIGGVALLRAAAKNFNDVLVITSPLDYPKIIEAMKANSITIELKQALAARAFRHTAFYDSLISNYFSKNVFTETKTIPLKLVSTLRYGENPHQDACVYTRAGEKPVCSAVRARQLGGKELSYNNYLDIESAWRLCLEFETPACVIVKHNNPCGCAVSDDIFDAYIRARSGDSKSAFGGIVAFNRDVDEKTASEAIKLFTECIIAPSYSEGAKRVFASKKNLRVLEQPIDKETKIPKGEMEYRALTGGMLIQNQDNELFKEIKCATKRKVSKEEKESLDFAWKVCKHVKSNAIILVRGKQTVGVGAGQMSRIDALKIASEKMKEIIDPIPDKSLPLVLASDAFFPFPDVVLESSKLGVSAIIQPGGSIRDEDSITEADKHNIAMVFTGMRHFRH